MTVEELQRYLKAADVFDYAAIEKWCELTPGSLRSGQISDKQAELVSFFLKALASSLLQQEQLYD